jgi:hypothetical protein
MFALFSFGFEFHFYAVLDFNGLIPKYALGIVIK